MIWILAGRQLAVVWRHTLALPEDANHRSPEDRFRRPSSVYQMKFPFFFFLSFLLKIHLTFQPNAFFVRSVSVHLKFIGAPGWDGLWYLVSLVSVISRLKYSSTEYLSSKVACRRHCLPSIGLKQMCCSFCCCLDGIDRFLEQRRSSSSFMCHLLNKEEY